MTAVQAEPRQGERGNADATIEHLYLMGRPPMRNFVRYVERNAVEPPGEAALHDLWRRARDVLAELERTEAGIADHPSLTPLGPDEPLLRKLLNDPLIRDGFNAVPTEVAMVDLRQVVVYQGHIDVTHARRLAEDWGTAPSGPDLFRICLPYDHPNPPVRWSRLSKNRYAFVSPSNDLRFLGPMPMDPGRVRDFAVPGNLVNVIGIAVGFGSNFLNAVHTGKRIILCNGSHRAYALRKMGVTHVPAIVQHALAPEEIEAVASTRVNDDGALYLEHPRPPMLQDYLDPRLHYLMAVRRRVRQVTVRFQVEEDDVPAL
ncbi:MAG TPA: hypothetical protein VJN62_03085 [Gemmatimonadales bacterium]|nr:hypothetical protein [Gemmatimonadales bacterium]